METLSTQRNKARRLKFLSEFENGVRTRSSVGTCSICKQDKPASEFYLSNTNTTGLHGWCKECSDTRTRENYRQRNLGITPEGYAKLLTSQGGVCCICKTSEKFGKKDFCVDHDHTTGKIRGVLCNKCNTVLGQVNDNVEILKAAIAYLEKNNED